MRLPLAVVVSRPIYQLLIVATGIPVVVRATVAPLVETVTVLAFGWMALRLVRYLGEEILQAMTRRARLGAVSVVSMARRILYAVIVTGTALLIASSFGLSLTGWFAALGIGGIAVALGTQKTIEHLVGGLSLVVDQPVRVGDFCSVGGLMGTVEDIGLRSTRLRTLENTLLTIPNGDMSDARIDNFAGRERFRWLATIGLTYDTTPQQMKAVLWRLDQLLSGDDRIERDHRARFVGFGESSLDVEIFAYIVADDFPTSLHVREEMNLAVMEIVAECGSGFAFPTRTLHMVPPASVAAAPLSEAA
ncbi:MAG: mechanosensitive ion channel family protein [Pseudomonadota bacterium]